MADTELKEVCRNIEPKWQKRWLDTKAFRAANPGDGLIGGTSAGFWVQLLSTGQVRVVRLQPMATIGFSGTPAEFDAGVFHRLEAEVLGERLRVRLDGEPVEFDAGGARASAVLLEPKWESASPKGRNMGSAGIAFGASRNRGYGGGQQARGIRLAQLRRR